MGQNIPNCFRHNDNNNNDNNDNNNITCSNITELKYSTNTNISYFLIQDSNTINSPKPYPHLIQKPSSTSISPSIPSSSSRSSFSSYIPQITLIQSTFLSFKYRKHFNTKHKQFLIERSFSLYNTLYEEYITYNTKLAESLIGYKYTLPLNYTHNPNTFHNTFLHYTKNTSIPSIYHGDTDINYKRSGYGIQLFKNGVKLEGIWKDDMFQGYGRMITLNGDLYEGIFTSDLKLNGSGMKRSLNGDVYIGMFMNGLKHGEGIEENNEIEYKGQFINDLRNGKGVIHFKQKNEVYEGEFVKGNLNGVGIYKFVNEDVYEGMFKDGKMHGKGVYKWKSGEEYYGEYVKGIKEGNGVFKYVNGKVYEGAFKQGKPNGKGKMIVKKNECVKEYVVVFKEGKIVESLRIWN